MKIGLGNYKTQTGHEVRITYQNPTGGWNGDIHRENVDYWNWWDDEGRTYNPENNLIGCEEPTLGVEDIRARQKQELNRNNEQKYYAVSVTCTNCEFYSKVRILKGISIKEHCCTNCGCSGFLSK